MTNATKVPDRKLGAPKKTPEGRPSKYRPEYAEQAGKLALLGLTDKQLGDFFGVDERTIEARRTP